MKNTPRIHFATLNRQTRQVLVAIGSNPDLVLYGIAFVFMAIVGVPDKPVDPYKTPDRTAAPAAPRP